MFKQNPLTSCDSYKLGHAVMYPEGTELIYSNFTPRSDAHLNIPAAYKKGKVVFFGAQALLMEMVTIWNREFFLKSIQEAEEMILDFGRRVAPFVGPMGFDLDRIRELHSYGRLPIEVRVLPEGSRVNIGVPVMIVMNTDPRFYWITNYLETWYSCEMWKMMNSATIADCYKQILLDAAIKTGSPIDFVQWQGHDFSMRGMSGVIDAAKSGAAHLLSFNGTDTLPAVDFLEHYYMGKDTFVGGSVPASEHSVVCAGGEDNELETFRRVFQDLYPSGVVSMVSDTWNFWDVVGDETSIAAKLKDIILARTPDAFGLAKVVFRPDSGDPVEILCGLEIETVPADQNLQDWALDAIRDKVFSETAHGECGTDIASQYFLWQDKVYFVSVEIEWNRYDKQYYYFEGAKIKSVDEVTLTPEQKGAVEALWDIFGGTMTDKGFKVLNQRVGLIYGDSITPQRALDILRRLADKGFASCNVVLGIGSYTYQYNTRDTLGLAMKATYGVFNGTGRALFKDPKTDSGMKKSAKGLLKVIKEDDNFILMDNQEDINDSGLLETIFKDGSFIKTETLEEIRTRLAS